MAKQALLQRELKREKLAAKFAKKYAELKATSSDFKRMFENYKKQAEQRTGQPVSTEEAVKGGLDERVLTEIADNEGLAELIRISGIQPGDKLIGKEISKTTAFFNAISGIVWLPLVIGWLGVGSALATFLIWNTVFFIVFQNTVLGVQLVPEVLEQGNQAMRWLAGQQAGVPISKLLSLEIAAMATREVELLEAIATDTGPLPLG
jgi:hypothetical protein